MFITCITLFTSRFNILAICFGEHANLFLRYLMILMTLSSGSSLILNESYCFSRISFRHDIIVLSLYETGISFRSVLLDEFKKYPSELALLNSFSTN